MGLKHAGRRKKHESRLRYFWTLPRCNSMPIGPPADDGTLLRRHGLPGDRWFRRRRSVRRGARGGLLRMRGGRVSRDGRNFPPGSWRRPQWGPDWRPAVVDKRQAVVDKRSADVTDASGGHVDHLWVGGAAFFRVDAYGTRAVRDAPCAHLSRRRRAN